MSLSANFETHALQNDFVVFFRLGVKDENGQALFSSLEAFTSKIQGKTVSTILVDHVISYDRTCQRSIKIISIEKTVTLHKSAQKRKIPGIFFLKERS